MVTSPMNLHLSKNEVNEAKAKLSQSYVELLTYEKACNYFFNQYRDRYYNIKADTTNKRNIGANMFNWLREWEITTYAIELKMENEGIDPEELTPYIEQVANYNPAVTGY